MAFERLIVVGASAGGIEAISQVAASLPADFPAPICVVMHTAPQSPGVLGHIIDAAGPLPAALAREGDRIRPGRIYVAPPDYHLLIEPGVLRLSRGPRENRFRPAVDPLFRSAAQVYGPRVIGVVLSGNLDDGTAGLWTIKQLGGVAVAQEPGDALFPGMPSSAHQHVAIDHSLRAREIGPALSRLVALSVHARPEEVARAVEVEVKIARGMDPLEAGIEDWGQPSRFACPDCHGVLREMKDGDRLRYRCHTGHAYSAASLVAASNEGIEDAFWNTIRALEEADMFLRHSAESEGDEAAVARLIAQADAAGEQARALRELVTSRRRLILSTSGDGENGR